MSYNFGTQPYNMFENIKISYTNFIYMNCIKYMNSAI